MSRPWWETDAPDRRGMVADRDLSEDRKAGRGAPWRRPRVVEDDPRAIAAEAFARREGFTPSWTSMRDDDAGRVLLDLFGEQVAATARCVNDLPLKARVELLDTAGIGRLPPRPHRALLALEISASAPRSVVIGEAFRVNGRDDDGRDVSFETDATIIASPGKIAAVAVEIQGTFEQADVPSLDERKTLRPFGHAPDLDSAVYIGIDTPIVPHPELSLGWFAAPRDGAPPPASAGGVATGVSVEPPPMLIWEILDGLEVTSAEILRDETLSLTRTGLVGLRTPLLWRPTTLPGSTTPLRWLRVRIAQGRYLNAPVVAHLAMNAVWATSGETMRREVLTPIARPGERARRFQLARFPVLANQRGATSLELVVDEGGAAPVPWTDQPDLASWRPDDRVYRLDPTTGVVEFGDGVRGRQLPDGFRHVQARSYRVHVPAGRVPAGAIASPAGSAPFVVGATNPAPASGAVAAETQAQILRRGPAELATRGRAVTVADYEVAALRAPGADVRRVHAEAGFHPQAPGRRVPGVVGLLVVSADRQDGAPPLPDEQTLRAISQHLAAVAAPGGVDVIAAAPRYVRVGVDLAFVPASSAFDIGEVVNDLIRRINRYLHPLTGGEAESGWGFGAPLRPVALVRTLLDGNEMVRALPRIAVAVDGVRFTDCGDVAIEPRALIWPDTHRVIPIAEEDVA